MNFLIWCRRRKGMRQKIRALEEENAVLRDVIMSQPRVSGMYLYVEDRGKTKVYVELPDTEVM